MFIIYNLISLLFNVDAFWMMCLKKRNLIVNNKKKKTILSQINVILQFFYLPGVNFALPPLGLARIVLQPTHNTTVCAWLNTVVILTQSK